MSLFSTINITCCFLWICGTKERQMPAVYLHENRFHMKTQQLCKRVIKHWYFFIYNRAREETERRKSIFLEIQGVNEEQSQRKGRLQIIKEKKKKEVERQTDWVTMGHKGEAGRKWTVPIMLWLFRGDKSQWKTHLKAPLLSSLIPAGGLGSTKPLPKHTQEGPIKCRPEWRSGVCPENKTKQQQPKKKQLSVSIAYAA